jgi:beta-lactamase regulating signal transducer with metallopeptidase domain
MTPVIDLVNRWGDAFSATIGPLFAQSSILILLLLLLQPLLRRRLRASVRYAIWMLVPLKLLLPPGLALPTSVAYWLAPARTVVATSDAPTAATSTTALASPPVLITSPAPVVATASIQPPVSASLTPAAWFFVIWLSGVLCLAAWIARGYFNGRRLVRASSPAPPQLVQLAEACRRDLGVRATLAVRCSEAVPTPALCGLTSPAIVIPASIANLDAGMLRPVLLHELAHYRRGDMWTNQVIVLAQLLHWFNPLTWIASSVIRRTREEAVDEVVVGQMRGEEATYASTLIHIAKGVLARRVAMTAGSVGIMESGNALRGRIERVLSSRMPQRTRLGWPAAVAVVCIGCVVLPMAPGRTVVAQTTEAALTDGGPSLLEPFLILIPGYEDMRRRQLLERVAARPDDVALLRQAADALLVSDQAQAQAFLERAIALEPDNPQVAASLAQLHSLRAQTSHRPEDWRLALEYAEKEQELKPGVSAMYLKLAQFAFDAGELPKAGEYATEYVEKAKASNPGWATGDLVHKGNTVLGRLAVRDGRLDDADRYLLASADTSGSPVLKSFGPNMSLAKDLLEAGRPEVVLKYFEACDRFWTIDFFRLRRWSSAVRAGRIPEFGPNLVY